LDAVTISLGGEVITSASTGTTVINGLTVNGKITLGNGSGSNQGLNFNGTQTVGGSGEIVTGTGTQG